MNYSGLTGHLVATPTYEPNKNGSWTAIGIIATRPMHPTNGKYMPKEIPFKKYIKSSNQKSFYKKTYFSGRKIEISAHLDSYWKDRKLVTEVIADYINPLESKKAWQARKGLVKTSQTKTREQPQQPVNNYFEGNVPI